MAADHPFLTWLTGVPLRIALIIAGAAALSLLLRWIVRRVVTRLSRLRGSVHLDRAQVAVGGSPARLGQRLRTFESVLNSTITAILATVALLMVVSELGVDVRPLIASAGIAGIAIAFGAQSLVRDVVSGIFMLAEDQYGVGDRVELASTVTFASGIVERVALRVTSVRDDDGRLWHVRNGEILRVANQSQGWAVASAEVRFAPATDVTAARETLLAATAQMVAEKGMAERILGEATVLVEDITAGYIMLRWSVQTVAGAQWDIASEMRRRIPGALREAGLELAS